MIITTYKESYDSDEQAYFDREWSADCPAEVELSVGDEFRDHIPRKPLEKLLRKYPSAVLAGGALTDGVMDRKPKDIDVFFSAKDFSKESVISAAKEWANHSQYYVNSCSDQAVTMLSGEESKQFAPVQFIWGYAFDSPLALVKQFDIDASKMWMHTHFGQVKLTELAYVAFQSKMIHRVEVEDMAKTFLRLVRYTAKGFRVSHKMWGRVLCDGVFQFKAPEMISQTLTAAGGES